MRTDLSRCMGFLPGSYEVWANAQGGSLAVTHMTATGAATEGHTLKVGSQPVAISATLAEGSATVTGFAKRDGKPAAGVMVLLAPKNPGADREMFRRDQSDSDGSFTLHQRSSRRIHGGGHRRRLGAGLGASRSDRSLSGQGAEGNCAPARKRFRDQRCGGGAAEIASRL